MSAFPQLSHLGPRSPHPGPRVLLLAALVLGFSSCSVMKASHQPEKKNLGLLRPGAPRTHLIAEVGAPVWSEQRNGETVDVFVFRQGYSKWTKAARVAGHSVADIYTLGLWELVGTPIETIADGVEIKLQVASDPQGKIQTIEVIEGPEKLRQALADRGLTPTHPTATWADGTSLPPTVISPAVHEMKAPLSKTACPRLNPPPTVQSP